MFQPQSLTESNPNDLLCDYGYAKGESDEDMRGFVVWINEELQTPDSPYARPLGLTVALPVDLGDGLEVTEASVERAYQIIETGAGGYFPVGAEKVWHGGVHLPTPQRPGAFVHAPLPGRVVASRLDATSGRRNNAYGSSRFVLLSHDADTLLGRHVPDVDAPFAGQRLFSLLMHVGPPALAPGEDIDADYKLAWLRETPTAYRPTAPLQISRAPTLTSADPLGTVRDTLGYGPEATSSDLASIRPVRPVASLENDATWYEVPCPGGASGYLHASTVTLHEDGTITPKSLNNNVRPIPSTTDAAWGQEVEADTILQIMDGADAPDGWLKVKVETKRRLWTEERVGYVPSTASMEPVRFAIRDDVQRALESDDVVVFDPETAPEVQAGDPVAPAGVYGNARSDADLVHLELFSTGEDSLYARFHEALRKQHLAECPPGEDPPDLFTWADAVDPNDDGKLADTQAVTELLRTPKTCTVDAAPDGAPSVIPSLLADDTLTRSEVRRFYAGHPDAERLRAFACQFVGEWCSVPDVYDWFSAERMLGSASAMMWWHDVAQALNTSQENASETNASGLSLPSSGRAWYYHPVRLLSLIARPPEVPSAGLVTEVTGPEQVVPGHPAEYHARLENHAFSTAAERATVNWVVKTADGAREITRREAQGTTWTFWPPLGLLHKEIRVMAYANSEAEHISQISKVVPGQWSHSFLSTFDG